MIWCIRACWNTLGTIRLSLHAALAALTVHIAYVVLMGMRPSQVLEVPLLALAGALEPAFRPVFYVVTVIVALNMNLFDGIGGGMGWAIPRGITFIDASVIVAAANVMALFWLSGLLRDLAAESAARTARRLTRLMAELKFGPTYVFVIRPSSFVLRPSSFVIR